MSHPTASPDDPGRRAGRRTAGKGTPVAVDVSADPQSRRTIAVFLTGPIIWSVHFMLVYLVAEAGCTGNGPGLELFNPPVPAVVTLIATAVAALGCLASAAWGYRRWRGDRHGSANGSGLEPADRGGALAFGGFIMSLLGFVTVLLVGVPALVLPPCA